MEKSWQTTPDQIPGSCRRLVYRHYGDETALAWRDAPLTAPGRNQVLIQVAAVSVNPVDWKILAGEQRLFTGRKLGKERVFGCDFAGTILALGDGTTGLAPGMRVCGLLNPLREGSFSQFLTVPATSCLTVPDQLDDLQAAALPAAGIAAIRALYQRPLGWWRGKSVFLNGASGGVGHLLLQLLSHQGALVWATASPDRHSGLREMGAVHTLDYRKIASVASLTDFDAVIDCHGSLALSHRHELFARPRGLFIPLSIANPQIPAVVAYAAWRHLSAGPDTRLVLAAPSRPLLAELLSCCAQGSLSPRLGAVFPADQADAAVALSRAGHAFGKIVVSLT